MVAEVRQAAVGGVMAQAENVEAVGYDDQRRVPVIAVGVHPVGGEAEIFVRGGAGLFQNQAAGVNTVLGNDGGHGSGLGGFTSAAGENGIGIRVFFQPVGGAVGPADKIRCGLSVIHRGAQHQQERLGAVCTWHENRKQLNPSGEQHQTGNAHSTQPMQQLQNQKILLPVGNNHPKGT